MLSFGEDDVKRALDLKVEALTEGDVERIGQNRAAVEALIAEVPEALGRARRQAELLFEFIVVWCEEKQAPFEAVAQAAGALLYLSSPLDLVPDSEEQGYLDDAAILEVAVGRIAPQLSAFCAARGLDPAQAL